MARVKPFGTELLKKAAIYQPAELTSGRKRPKASRSCQQRARQAPRTRSAAARKRRRELLTSHSALSLLLCLAASRQHSPAPCRMSSPSPRHALPLACLSLALAGRSAARRHGARCPRLASRAGRWWLGRGQCHRLIGASSAPCPLGARVAEPQRSAPSVRVCSRACRRGKQGAKRASERASERVSERASEVGARAREAAGTSAASRRTRATRVRGAASEDGGVLR
jgi:hypothetical protein